MMKPMNILLLGAGGHARSCIDLIESINSYVIAGLIGLEDEVGVSKYGYKVLGTDENLTDFSNIYSYALICVGQIHSPLIRIKLYEEAKKIGFQLPILISPFAYVSKHAVIGDGSVIMPGAVINAGAMVGVNCIINSKALIEHDVKVGNHCHVSTGSVLNGSVTIGDGTFIGSGSVVRENVHIGSNCLIAMGSKVRSSVPLNTKFFED